jgi:transcriptional regulator with XRE-family HTH domain
MINERLKLARKDRFASAREAASALGLSYDTYIQYERGIRGMSIEHADRFARFFGADFTWLATGRGERKTRRGVATLEIDGKVGAGAIVPIEAEERLLADYGRIDLDLGGNIGGLVVVGDSQLPRWYAGEIIVYDRSGAKLADLVETYCIVQDMDGNRFVKILTPSAVPEKWRLESHNARPIDRVDLMGGFRILATIHRHPSDMTADVARPAVKPHKRR